MQQYQLPVIMYNRIVGPQDKLGKHKIYIPAAKFRQQMISLKNRGYETITFRQLADNPEIDLESPPKIIITFGDGYQDNYFNAFPVLRELGFTAVVFLVTRKSENTWSMMEGEPPLPLLVYGQIIEMDQYGIEFGAHSQTHRPLSFLDHNEIIGEVNGSKLDLEGILGKETVSFAYPYGHFNQRIMDVVKQSGFRYGVSANIGVSDFRENPYQIRLIRIGRNTMMPAFRFKTSGRFFTTKSIWSFLSAH